MGIMPDWMIRELCVDTNGNPLPNAMITPYEEGIKRPGKISYGVSSYGYDVRIGNQFYIFSDTNCGIVDPKSFDPKNCVHKICGDDERLVVPPHSFVLGESVETFNIPRDVLVVCLGKSTYARCAAVVNVTPLEPEWKGKVTIEISNTAPVPLVIYPNEGIMQVLFLKTAGHYHMVIEELLWGKHDIHNKLGRNKGACEISYADKAGKYQNQTAVTMPTVDK